MSLYIKPRVFIGSSSESLNIAYALQSNLNTDANVTVWTENIFQLSSNSLDDLLVAVENFDFGIFIFKPDDITHMRNDKFNVVRDNVIFELGLFFGKLGKDRVFFVSPNEVQDFHLPTDLLGVMAGRYDNSKEQDNLESALEPFCNQVRLRIKTFVYQSLAELSSESNEVKKIAAERRDYWEMQLTAALLRSRMTRIKYDLDEVQKGYVFKKTVKYSIKGFIEWYDLASTDIIRIIKIARQLHEKEIERSWGLPGVTGDIHEIKSVVEKIATICRHLVNWEIDLQTIIAPDELRDIPNLMSGWSNKIVDEFVRLPDLLSTAFTEENIAKSTVLHIEIIFHPPHNVDRILEIIENIRHKIEQGILSYE